MLSKRSQATTVVIAFLASEVCAELCDPVWYVDHSTVVVYVVLRAPLGRQIVEERGGHDDALRGRELGEDWRVTARAASAHDVLGRAQLDETLGCLDLHVGRRENEVGEAGRACQPPAVLTMAVELARGRASRGTASETAPQ